MQSELLLCVTSNQSVRLKTARKKPSAYALLFNISSMLGNEGFSKISTRCLILALTEHSLFFPSVGRRKIILMITTAMMMSF